MRPLSVWSAALLVVACTSERPDHVGSARPETGGRVGSDAGAGGAVMGGAAGASAVGTAESSPRAGASGSGEPQEKDCRDGIDDDGDELTDCADRDCAERCARSCGAVPELVGAGKMGSLADHADDIELTCGAGGPELVYQYRAGRDGELSLRLSAAADLRVAIRTRCDSDEDLACDAEKVSVPVEADEELFVVVEGIVQDDEEPYFALTFAGCGDGVLDSGEECDDGGRLSEDGCSDVCELESSEGPDNGSIAGADELSGERYFGTMDQSGDADLVHLAVDSEATEIDVTSVDFGGGCVHGQSTTLELLSSDGVEFIADTEPLAGSCAALATSGLASGDYYIRVASSGDERFAYVLNVMLATCGNGTRELGEMCDDGNTQDSDGCDSDCVPD